MPPTPIMIIHAYGVWLTDHTVVLPCDCRLIFLKARFVACLSDVVGKTAWLFFTVYSGRCDILWPQASMNWLWSSVRTWLPRTSFQCSVVLWKTWMKSESVLWNILQIFSRYYIVHVECCCVTVSLLLSPFFIYYWRLRSRKQRLTAVGISCTDHVTPLYLQKLALTSPTGGGRSVGIVRSRTKATEIGYYNFACCFVWVWSLVADSKGGKEAEGVWEYGVEENIWT